MEKEEIPHETDSIICVSKEQIERSMLTSSGTQTVNQNNVNSEIESNLLDGLKNLSVKDENLKPATTHFKNQNRKLSTSKIDNSDQNLDPLTRATKLLQSNDISKIVVLVGAGLSTNSGIMDFRTPGTGLYDNLQQYDIPYPEAIFDIDYFKYNPKPFFALAKELYPSVKYRPNYNHYFLRLLQDKGLLLRLYTQNIDGLEQLSGIPYAKVIESHGSFAHATCLSCRKKYKGNEVKHALFKEDVPKCKHCKGIVKPDIVFFGEDLPKSFYQYQKDMSRTELVLIMGTSLEVHPFAGIIDYAPSTVPRILFNMKAVGPFRTSSRANDFTVEGDLTESLEQLVTQLNWQAEMLKLLTDAEGKKYANKFHKEFKELNSPLKESDPKLENSEQNSLDSEKKTTSTKSKSK
ncbi:NAD-dependent protein deacetylase sirtuin-3 isoform X2 [Octopus sinensis]|uniref:NAD-dependent protein deacetylase sirtuin-3 isoform X2 n=1 Tax=Octopus sinensis TaxID=2607531 RepID=A0A6P7SXD8_9MOLL|nr:NAD-dependent protein deacetylase sirtuin-3 isoform X2 [Octopus sinensis]